MIQSDLGLQMYHAGNGTVSLYFTDLYSKTPLIKSQSGVVRNGIQNEGNNCFPVSLYVYNSSGFFPNELKRMTK